MDKKQISMVLHAASEAHDRQDLQAWLGQDVHPSISKIDLMAVAIESLFADRLSALSPRVVTNEMVERAGVAIGKALGFNPSSAFVEHKEIARAALTAALSSAGEKEYYPSQQELVEAYEARGCRDDDPSPHPTSADKLKVVAYSYSLATRILGGVIGDKAYASFEDRLTTYAPNVPEGSLRELEPLVRHSDATRIITEQAESIAELKRERDVADNALVDKYRDPETGNFSFPGDVARIIERLDIAEADRDRIKEALRALLDEETVSVHVGYDNGVGGGNYIYADAVRTDSAAFANARAALSQATGGKE